MSKAGGVALSAYWPEGIPRQASIPQRPLPALVARHVESARDRPAVVGDQHILTYGELDMRMQRVAGGLAAMEPRPTLVAVIEPAPADGLALLLGSLDAGARVAVLDPAAPPDVLTTRLRLLQADVILSTAGPAWLEGLPGRVVAEDELPPPAARGPRSTRPAPPREPAVLLSRGTGFVAHSQFTLAAMVRALTGFVPELRELDFVGATAPFEWESLTGALSALLSGRSVAFGPAAAAGGRPEDSYTILRRADADAIVKAGRGPDELRLLRYVFLSTGPFRPRWRRRLETAIGRPVLPVWGTVETGPAVASHPTWFPIDRHGIPIVNVTITPVDPATKQISSVPWELLDRAEMGVDSPSVMVGAVAEEPPAEPPFEDNIFRTGAIVEMDQVGIIRFIG